MLTINEAIQLIETELESQEENIKIFITGKGQQKVGNWTICQRIEISDDKFYRMTKDNRNT